MMSTKTIYHLKYVLLSCTQITFKISKLKPYPSFSNKKQEKELVLKNCYKGTNLHTFL